jgi:hypothetical protein
MRNLLGFFCYCAGAVIAMVSLQLVISCEIIATLGPAKSNSFVFWPYLGQAPGEHSAHYNGYLVHWLRDLLMFLSGTLVIRLGRKQFIQRPRSRPEKRGVVTLGPAAKGFRTQARQRPIRRVWVQMMIAFNESYVLRRTNKTFQLPVNHNQLVPDLKRKLTICNLFANQNQPLNDIARLLDINRALVISTLIEQGLVKERRKRRTRSMK